MADRDLIEELERERQDRRETYRVLLKVLSDLAEKERVIAEMLNRGKADEDHDADGNP